MKINAGRAIYITMYAKDEKTQKGRIFWVKMARMCRQNGETKKRNSLQIITLFPQIAQKFHNVSRWPKGKIHSDVAPHETTREGPEKESVEDVQ